MIRNEKGAALALVLIVLAVGLVMAVVTLSLGEGELFQVSAQERYIQAHYNARSAAAAFGSEIIAAPALAPASGATKTGTVDFSTQGGTGGATVNMSRVGNLVYIEAVGNTGSEFQRTTVLRLRSLEPELLPFQDPIVSDTGINLTNLWIDAEAGIDEFDILTVDTSTNEDDIENPNGLELEVATIDQEVFDTFPDVVLPTGAVARNSNDFNDGLILNQITGGNPVPIQYSNNINRNGNVEFRTNNQNMTVIVDSCRINGIISITGTGYLTLYVVTNLDISSANTDVLNPPEKFFVMLDDGATMDILGNSTFRGYVYGPDSGEVRLQGGVGSPISIEGAMIVNELTINGNPHFTFNPLTNPDDYFDLDSGFVEDGWLDAVPD